MRVRLEEKKHRIGVWLNIKPNNNKYKIQDEVMRARYCDELMKQFKLNMRSKYYNSHNFYIPTDGIENNLGDNWSYVTFLPKRVD